MAAKIDIVRCRIDENHVLDACAEIEKKDKMIRIEMNEYYQPAMKVMIADDDNVIYALCSAEG